ncbi:VgrG-related protein [Lysobacter claricitrinus]|uniref:VgrG-related protein n=1 Tax=Lysobacter claricitrinus TaxID=3367728 RepID=UPI0037DB38CD
MASMNLRQARKRVAQWRLGSTSSRYESSGRGAGVISSGKGDAGGKSYGEYQLSSRTGTLQQYLAQSYYAPRFAALEPGTPAFDAMWTRIAASDPAFARDQHDFIGRTHYDAQLARLRDAGIDLSGAGYAVHDMLWSTAVQYGALTLSIVTNALHGTFGAAADATTLTDAQIVGAVQDYKLAHLQTLFAHSKPLWPGLRRRVVDEKRDLLRLADAECIVVEADRAAAERASRSA